MYWSWHNGICIVVCDACFVGIRLVALMGGGCLMGEDGSGISLSVSGGLMLRSECESLYLSLVCVPRTALLCCACTSPCWP